MKIYLVRHGKTTSTNPFQIFGQQEIPLSQEGIPDMKKLTSIVCERIYCSPLERAHKSAEIISQNNIPIQKDVRLSEIHFGEYGGKDVRKLKNIFPDKYRTIISPNEPFPQGESVHVLAKRILDFHTELLSKKYSSVCIVSHQWALNTYLKTLFGIPLTEKNTFIFEHGTCTVLEISEMGVTLVGHNMQPPAGLDPLLVKEEFNRRAHMRQGIDKVLTDRYSSDINKQFNANITHLLNRYLSGTFTSVLEVGVGMGRLIDFFKERSGTLLGIDFSENILRLAKEYTKDEKNITFIQDDAATVDLGNSRFDLGIASLVLKHNSDENAKKILEKLKKHTDSILLIEHVCGGALGSSIAQIRDEQWYLHALSPFSIAVHHRFLRGNDHMIFTIAKR